MYQDGHDPTVSGRVPESDQGRRTLLAERREPVSHAHRRAGAHARHRDPQIETSGALAGAPPEMSTLTQMEMNMSNVAHIVDTRETETTKHEEPRAVQERLDVILAELQVLAASMCH